MGCSSRLAGSPRTPGCTRPTSVSGRALGRELEKRAFLLELGVERFDLSGLPPNRRAWLAQAGRQQTNQALARLAPKRRYPVLAAFCVEALERVTDDAIEVFDRALGAADRAAQRKREELDRRGRRDIQSTVRRFIDLSAVVLEAHDSGTDVMRLIQRRIGIDQLRADLDRAQGIARPAETGHIDLLIADSGAAGRKPAERTDSEPPAAAGRRRRGRAARRPAVDRPARRRQAPVAARFLTERVH